MKVKINAYLVRELFDLVACEVIIEFGKIQLIKFENRQIFNDFKPSEETQYIFEKIFYEKYHKNLKYTYHIKYTNQAGKNKELKLKPTILEVIRIKLALKKCWFQTKEVKVDLYKYLITGALSFIFGMIAENYRTILTSNEQSNTSEIEEKSATEYKILENKKTIPKDSIIAKK